MNILDIGCGVKPKGSINCDKFLSDYHRQEKIRLNPHKITNFFLCDSQYLPFKNESFDLVISSHVIEHVEKPVLMLQEMIRVSKQHVEINCPHRYSKPIPECHKHFFGARFFDIILSRMNVFYRITINYKMRPKLFPIFRMPDSMNIQIIKFTNQV